MKSKVNYKKIDVHNHIYPKSYIKELKKRKSIPKVEEVEGEDKFYIFPENITKSGRPLNSNFYDINKKIKIMDTVGIDKAVISLGNPWVDCYNSEDSVKIAKKMNNKIHELVKKYPERLIGIGVLPLKNVEAAIEEMKRMIEDLSFKGSVIGSNIDGMYLDDPELEKFYEEANKLNFNLYVHPRDPYGINSLTGYQHTLPLSLGFPFDTTLSLSRLILGGVMDRYPNINFIGSHAGGAIPYIMNRIDQASDYKELGLKKEPSRYVKEDIYFDTIIYGTDQLDLLHKISSVDKILFATDNPFPITDIEEMIEQVGGMDLSENELKDIFYGNAEKLFNI